jgi:hypothetical protein
VRVYTERMKILVILYVLLFLSPAAVAQGFEPEGEILPAPLCSNLINRSKVTIHGSIETAKQELSDGTEARHVSNFKLAPEEETKICVSGPFYEGRRVGLTIRTLFPLFTCNTKLGQDIYLDATSLTGEGWEYSATCR